jgi:hypothetical protein
MALRNWWIEAKMDDSDVVHTFGPRAKDSGFEISVYQRDDGQSKLALHIEAFAYEDGRLQLDARMGSDFWRPGNSAIIVTSQR